MKVAPQEPERLNALQCILSPTGAQQKNGATIRRRSSEKWKELFSSVCSRINTISVMELIL